MSPLCSQKTFYPFPPNALCWSVCPTRVSDFSRFSPEDANKKFLFFSGSVLVVCISNSNYNILSNHTSNAFYILNGPKHSDRARKQCQDQLIKSYSQAPIWSI